MKVIVDSSVSSTKLPFRIYINAKSVGFGNDFYADTLAVSKAEAINHVIYRFREYTKNKLNLTPKVWAQYNTAFRDRFKAQAKGKAPILFVGVDIPPEFTLRITTGSAIELK